MDKQYRIIEHFVPSNSDENYRHYYTIKLGTKFLFWTIWTTYKEDFCGMMEIYKVPKMFKEKTDVINFIDMKLRPKYLPSTEKIIWESKL